MVMFCETLDIRNSQSLSLAIPSAHASITVELVRDTGHCVINLSVVSIVVAAVWPLAINVLLEQGQRAAVETEGILMQLHLPCDRAGNFWKGYYWRAVSDVWVCAPL